VQPTIIVPYTNSFLANDGNNTNVTVQSQCFLRYVDHITIPLDGTVYSGVHEITLAHRSISLSLRGVGTSRAAVHGAGSVNVRTTMQVEAGVDEFQMGYGSTPSNRQVPVRRRPRHPEVVLVDQALLERAAELARSRTSGQPPPSCSFSSATALSTGDVGSSACHVSRPSACGRRVLGHRVHLVGERIARALRPGKPRNSRQVASSRSASASAGSSSEAE
jgi:hypothetical protein